MTYLYETHLHTAGISACAVSNGTDYIKGYRDMGYAGIIVTDHFLHGNSALPKNLPWKEWVHRFCRGYEEAKEEGERQGLDVFFGWEETFDNSDDYLIYGLDKDWLLEHPECRKWTRGEQYSAVKAAGGCVVQAHPFRQHYWINKVVLSAGCVDGIEAANRSNDDCSYDALAFRYAQKTGKAIVAGTDMHDASEIYTKELFGVYLDRKMKNITDYVKAICNNEVVGIKTDPSRCDYRGYETVRIPVDVRDENDRITGRHWKEFL